MTRGVTRGLAEPRVEELAVTRGPRYENGARFFECPDRDDERRAEVVAEGAPGLALALGGHGHRVLAAVLAGR